MVNDDGWAGWPKALGELPLAEKATIFKRMASHMPLSEAVSHSHTEMTVVNNKLHLCPPPGNVSKSCFLSGHVLPVKPFIHDMVMWLSLLPVMGSQWVHRSSNLCGLPQCYLQELSSPSGNIFNSLLWDTTLTLERVLKPVVFPSLCMRNSSKETMLVTQAMTVLEHVCEEGQWSWLPL